MAGSERSGPLAASAALFDGRPWAVTPHRHARPDAVRLVEALVLRVRRRAAGDGSRRSTTGRSPAPPTCRTSLAVLVAGRLAAAPSRAPRPLGPGRPRRHAGRGGRPGAVAADPGRQLRRPCSTCSPRSARTRRPDRRPSPPTGPRTSSRSSTRGDAGTRGDPRQARRPGATDALGLRRGARPPGRAGPALRRRRRDRHQHRGRPHRPRPGTPRRPRRAASSSAAAPSTCWPLSNPAGGRPTGRLLAREHRRTPHRPGPSSSPSTARPARASRAPRAASPTGSGLRYLDTGAMFRAMTWWLLREGVDVHDAAAVAAAARTSPIIESGTDPLGPTITVDGIDVAVAIRGDEVNAAVSPVSAVPEVRARLLELQREAIGDGRHRRRGPRHRLRRVAAGRGQGLPERRPRRPRRSVVRPSRAAPTSPATQAVAARARPHRLRARHRAADHGRRCGPHRQHAPTRWTRSSTRSSRWRRRSRRSVTRARPAGAAPTSTPPPGCCTCCVRRPRGWSARRWRRATCTTPTACRRPGGVILAATTSGSSTGRCSRSSRRGPSTR